jgi:hypothetical protein
MYTVIHAKASWSKKESWFMNNDIVVRIVDRILSNLTNRSGFGEVWCSCEEITHENIKADLENIVRREMERAGIS